MCPIISIIMYVTRVSVLSNIYTKYNIIWKLHFLYSENLKYVIYVIPTWQNTHSPVNTFSSYMTTYKLRSLQPKSILTDFVPSQKFHQTLKYTKYSLYYKQNQVSSCSDYYNMSGAGNLTVSTGACLFEINRVSLAPSYVCQIPRLAYSFIWINISSSSRLELEEAYLRGSIMRYQ